MRELQGVSLFPLRLGVPIHELSPDPLWLRNHCKPGSWTHPIRSVEAVHDAPLRLLFGIGYAPSRCTGSPLCSCFEGIFVTEVVYVQGRATLPRLW